MTAPEPILKGIFRDSQTGRNYRGFYLKHNADAGEEAQDDCMITVPEHLDGGEHNCGESGCFPMDDFAARFAFVRYPNPQKKFGP